jgi:nucleotide-binding universal stress UspA family protein
MKNPDQRATGRRRYLRAGDARVVSLNAHADEVNEGEGGRIVVGIDDTPAGLAALRRAVNLARSANAGLVAVRSWAVGLPKHGGRRQHRTRLHPHVVLYFDGTEQREASAAMVRKAFRIVAGGIPQDITVTIATPEGEPGAVLTEVAAADDDVLVVGAEPRWSIRRILHGSVGDYCCGHAHCPVIVVPAGGDGESESAS